MKYTKYLINGEFLDINSIIPRGILKYPIIAFIIPIVIIGIFTIGGMLPIAYIGDSFRNLKCITIRFKRKNQKFITIPNTIRIINRN